VELVWVAPVDVEVVLVDDVVGLVVVDDVVDVVVVEEVVGLLVVEVVVDLLVVEVVLDLSVVEEVVDLLVEELVDLLVEELVDLLVEELVDLSVVDRLVLELVVRDVLVDVLVWASATIDRSPPNDVVSIEKNPSSSTAARDPLTSTRFNANFGRRDWTTTGGGCWSLAGSSGSRSVMRSGARSGNSWSAR
jgi:hypothetical protein